VATPQQNERLESWKEISSFVGRDERTARRWEKELGMPVHRAPGAAQGRVYALRAELEAWLQQNDQKDSNHAAPVNGGEALGAESLSARDDAASFRGSALPASLDSSSALPTPPRSSQAGSAFPSPSRRSGWIWLAAAACATLVLWLSDGTLVRSFNPVPPRVLRFRQLTDDAHRKLNLRTGGTTLYFNEGDGEREVLASVPATGGAVQHVPAPFSNPWLQDVSADGQRLLVESREAMEADGPLWTLSATGGSAQRLGDVLCHAAAWSPDGTHVAYANRTGLYLADADGSNSRLLFQSPGTPENLRWSPDGRRLRFVVRDKSSYLQSPWELEVGSAATLAAPESLNRYFGEDCCSDWSWTRAEKYFLFLPPGREPWHLRVTSSEEWNPRSAAANTQEIPVGLGRLLGLAPGKDAHSVYLIGSSVQRGEFLRVEAGSAQVVRHLTGISAEYLAYSRDGRWISYTKLPDHSLWRSRADGSEAVQLASAPLAVQLSAWSPDGGKIAFMAQAPGKPWRIFVVSRDGGNPQEAAGGDDQQGAPTWFPDGQRIAYGNVLCQLAGTCAIHLIHLADRSVETLPGSEGARTARWSPDGKYIAALHADAHEVRLFDVQQRRWITLADSIAGDDMAWSRDSRYVYVNILAGSRQSYSACA
jgi:Tol biopolymer transport system component